MPHEEGHREVSSFCCSPLGPWAQVSGSSLPESTSPRPTPAAGGPGRWSCSQTRPCPRRSRGCTGTRWCSARGTSRSWKRNVGPESCGMLSPSGLAHRLEGKLHPTTTAQAPILSLPSCPSAALTCSPGVRKPPPPRALWARPQPYRSTRPRWISVFIFSVMCSTLACRGRTNHSE